MYQVDTFLKLPLSVKRQIRADFKLNEHYTNKPEAIDAFNKLPTDIQVQCEVIEFDWL